MSGFVLNQFLPWSGWHPASTFTRLSVAWRAVVWSGCCLIAAPAAGQNPFEASPAGDNPFGASSMADEPTPFGGSAADDRAAAADNAPAAAAPPQEDNNPIVRLLRETPPQTPREMSQGLEWVVRLKRWDEVRRLLDEIAAKSWQLSELAELAKAAEPGLWLRLSIDEAGLSEPQRQLVDKILAAPAQLAADVAWLDQWIDRLGHAQAGERRLAQLRLQDGGRVAIERLLQRLLSGDARVEPGMLAGTLAQFGEQGQDALRAAALTRDPQRAGRVLLGLAEVPGNIFSAEVGAGLASTQLSAETHEQLTEVVQRRYGRVPSTATLHDFLRRMFKASLGDYQQTRANDLPVTQWVWRTTADGNSVQAVEASEQDRVLEAVARLAGHRLTLAQVTTDDLVDCGAVLSQRAYQVSPVEAGGWLVDFSAQVAEDPSYWIRVFDRASELQFHGGAVKVVYVLTTGGLGGLGLPDDFLTRLLGDERPPVRYLALQYLAQQGPPVDFAAAEKATRVALEMTQLGRGPRVLVVGRSAELRAAAEQQLVQQIAAQVTSAHSAQAALLALEGATPIEMIVIVDRLADQSLFELLQRLRGSRRGQALPIAVMTDELYKHEQRLIAETPGVVVSLLSRAPDHMQRVVSQLEQRLDTRSFTAQQRSAFASSATEFLTRIAGDRQRFARYAVSDVRTELLSLGTDLPYAAQLQVLAGLGGRSGQLQLSVFARRESLSAAERMQAAEAFANSVQRSGVQLGREEVLATYDAYNSLGPQDPATAAALGVVLDAIERRAAE